MFFSLLKTTIEVPRPYSPFHIAFFAAVILIAVLLCVFFRDADDGTFSIIILLFWAIIAVLETIKQFRASYVPEPYPHYEYAWYAFPFQLCSSPLYTLPVVALTAKKGGAVFDAFASFTAIFSLVGGALVMVNPASVFIDDLFIDIQTMIHHGTQVFIGVFIAAHCRKKYDIKFFLKGLYVFLGGAAIALVLNLIVHTFYEGYFNMFYISPYFYDDVPTFGSAFGKFPYPLVAAGYLIAIAAMGYIIYIIEKYLPILFAKKKRPD